MRVTSGGHTFTSTARRAQIVAATIDTIAELGYNQTSFARIAERAGLSSTRLISYHFAGKDELMAAVLADVLQRLARHMGERVDAARDARGRLRAYITGLVEFVAGHRPQMKAVMEIFLHPSGDLSSYGPGDDRDALGHLEAILRDGQERGEFRAFDPFVMATAIQRSMDGLPFLLQTRPDLDLEAYARELCVTFDLATRSPEAS
ncbi:TetR family transcriptional regulator [Actinomadura sp. ATCC 31491]|uniref:TetR family transcriptional regulator n=1 Tax=Actinomadura luzonensis TaxID=2805427 RepID=A0ABT0G9N2_9ACTN|nr:TetR/AcrR family transcriptional regulator [Actinomadura luzonensis]MCK2221315.1 TetR family transcriptional regulator [Actinomadura luzonensis]